MDATTETRLQHKRRFTEFLDSDVRNAGTCAPVVAWLRGDV